MLTTWWFILLLLVVIAGTMFLLWKLIQGQKTKPAGAAVERSSSDTLFLARGASQRLSDSSRPAMARLPLVLVVGDTGATKTTLIVNSGLDPELLAGQDQPQHGGPVPSTSCANFWLAGGAVFVEAGGPLLANPGGLAELAAALRGGGMARWFGAAKQAPRALVVCVNAEDFLRSDASTASVAAAKRLRPLLGDVAQTWSTRMPMYVVFTKMDRVKYFADYVRNLSFDEAGRVFGMTLPLAASLQPGIYNQEQAARLNGSFDQLENSFLDSRMELLRRENESALTPNTFEFPREYRKLRDDMVRFLVELGRPSQLQATPFLRGFYFTGARPVTVGGARVPQWVFLPGFFRDALLGDRLAFQAASANTGAGEVRNWLLGAATAVSLIWLAGATVSFFNNRLIAQTSREVGTRAATPRLGSLESLRAVEELRLPASVVSDHMKFRPPMSYRWGLYPGEPMQAAVRDTYCRELQRSLLSETRKTLALRLAALPPAPGPADDYDTPYGDLKAYLMLTSNRERSDPAFLASLPPDRWALGAAVPDELAKLARTQFRFLGEQGTSGLCGEAANSDAVERARAYLKRFPLLDRAYRSMLDEVNRQGPPVRFVDSTNAMSDPREVGFAFSKPGYGLMKSALGKALEYLDREEWVLGKNNPSGTSQDKLLSDLSARYDSDFVAQWNAFVDGASVHRFANLKDAAAKLTSLASSTSPMLRLFCLVSVNTQVENTALSGPFQPFQAFAAPGTCATAANGPGNQAYMQGLIGLQVGVDRIASAPNPDAERLTESDPAKTAAMTTAQQLNLGAKPAQLLKDPILYAEGLLKGVPVSSANGKGAGFCAELRPVLGKYPFNPASGSDAAPAELAAVFAPTAGRLFTYPQEALQEFVAPTLDGRFMAKPDARVPVNPGFLGFLNRGAALSKFFYAGGPQVRVAFSLQVAPSPDIESVTLQIGGKTLRAGSGGGRQDFVWPDDTMSVRFQARSKDTSPPAAEFSGVWAVTRFLAAADENFPGSVVFHLRNTASLGRSAGTKSEVPLRINIETKGSPLTLLPRDLQLGCVRAIAR